MTAPKPRSALRKRGRKPGVKKFPEAVAGFDAVPGTLAEIKKLSGKTHAERMRGIVARWLDAANKKRG